MSGVKPYFAVIAAVLALQACGKLSEDDARKMDPHQSRFPRMQVRAELIEGDWDTNCQVEMADNGTYEKTHYTFNTGIVTRTVSVFRDPGCGMNPVWKRVYSGQYEVVLDELRQQFFSLSVLSQDARYTTLLNLGDTPADRYCKAEVPFQTGQEANFSPITQCAEETEQVSKVDLRGQAGFGRELFIDNIRYVRR